MLRFADFALTPVLELGVSATDDGSASVLQERAADESVPTVSITILSFSFFLLPDRCGIVYFRR